MNRRIKLPVLIIMSAITTSATAMELRLQGASVPGYSKVELRNSDVWGDADEQTYTVPEDRGYAVGAHLAFLPELGWGMITGLDVSYRKSGTSTATITEFGGGGRIGYGKVEANGWRYEGGARIGLTRATSDHAYTQTAGNNYTLTSSQAIGFGMQFSLYIGTSYRVYDHLVVGLEAAFEHNFLEMSAGGIYHDIDGFGAAGAMYVGYIF